MDLAPPNVDKVHIEYVQLARIPSGDSLAIKVHEREVRGYLLRQSIDVRLDGALLTVTAAPQLADAA
jgi:hypothetical protein